MAGLRPLQILIWKNWIIHKRHYIWSIFELLLPLLCSFILVYIASRIPASVDFRSQDTDSSGVKHVNVTIYSPYNLQEYYKTIRKKDTFLFAPNNSATRELMENVFKEKELRVLGFESEEQLEAFVTTDDDVIGAAIFLDFDESSTVLKYKLRISEYYGFKTEQTYYISSQKGPRIYKGYRTGYAESEYLRSNFLNFQAAIDLAFINLHKKEKSIKDIVLLIQGMLYPPYNYLDMSFSLIDLIPMMIIYGFIVFVPLMVKRIIDEKSNRAKEMMKMMGMTTASYWGSVFVSNLILMTILSLIITILYSIAFGDGISVIGNTSSTLFFMLMFLYCAASILFCFVITTIFNKAALAVIATIILWITSYAVPSTLLMPFRDNDFFVTVSLSDKLLSCLLPNMALTWASKIMSTFKQFDTGSHWDNLFEAPYKGGDGFSLGHILGMLILSCFLYSLLIWYLDSVWPWQPGVPKPPYFCFLKSYWSNYHEEADFPIIKTCPSSYFEEEPITSTPSVAISHLIKKFKVGNVDKFAVNDVTLNLYPGQITVLLGHNGAGKTTTMSILTGMFPPTSGTVIVNGYNILTETTSARKSLGLCPQHNVLYDNLTVKEHLKFFGGLKNLPWSEMEEEIAKILALLQLSDKQNALSKDLSGGMKRKLSLGIAIIGGSKILILDEPTSGMDPEARRVIWDALLELRGDRTVLLTTHYMEEADALGDRIAIMAEGSVKCCGSSIFLKGKFGTGYHLHIAKGDGCKVDEITRRINRLIPEAKIVSNINQKLVYSLSSVSQSFGTLFESMENSYSELGIVSCGISVTTMEDVFLKVGKMSENNLEEPANDCETEILINSYDNNDSKLANSSRATGSQLVVQQMKGLFLKRFHYAKRDYVILIFQLIIPILVISNLMWIVNKFNRTTEVKPLDLNLKKLYSSTNAFYNMMNEKETPFLNYYKDKLKEEDAMIFNTNDTTEYQLERSDNLKRYIETDLVGASIFEEDGNLTIISWFNAVPYHLDAISLNLMTTSLLKYLSKNNESDIQITNHPLPSTLSFSHRALVEMASHLIYIVFVALALTFLTSSFILFPIHERVTKCKLLQRMCGINAIVFWFIHLLWDFLIHVFCSFLLLIPFFIYSSINSTLEGCAIGAMFFVLIIYGWASLPLIYLMSFIPNKSSTGFSLFTIVGITTGLIAGVIVFSLNKSNVMDKEDMDLTLAILQLSPVFAAGWAISNIHNTSLYNTMCDQFDKSVIDSICESRASHELFKCCPREICQDECFEKENYLSWEFSSGRGLAFLSFDGLLYFTLLVMFETILPKLWYKIMTKIRRKNKSWMVKNNSIYPDEDSDVTQERNRIENIFNQPERNDEALIVKNLTKYFGSFRAVNNLTFSVHKEECFGLLGINGAGKTTTFRMLTGDLIPSEGNAFIGDYDVQNQTEMFQRAIGYCPQFDALIDGVTGREMLTIFANLRGIPKLDINYVVNRLIEMCDLVKHADKKTETYSGGTKRKLSLGLALIGSPSLVLLDEPTAGVDPVSRRKMWETLITMRQLLGVSFVLTSHGMDECEALCKRIVIMVNGQFHCLGDMQHLKTKFGQGYTLIIKVKRAEGNEIQEVKSFVENTFPSSSLKDSHQEILHYHITDTSVKWSKMFFKMEEAKQTLPVEDYLISDTTLEQIFLAFARTQMETQNMTE